MSACVGGTATFTCVVMWANGTNPSGASWVTGGGLTNVDTAKVPDHTVSIGYGDGYGPITTDNNTVTTTLMVTNVKIADNKSDYLCAQGVMELSDTVYLTVIGELYLNF